MSDELLAFVKPVTVQECMPSWLHARCEIFTERRKGAQKEDVDENDELENPG